MSSNNISFVHKDRIIDIKNPDPNETLLNYIRTKLKKLELKKVVPKVAAEHAQSCWVN